MGINLIDGSASSLEVFIMRDIVELRIVCQWVDERRNGRVGSLVRSRPEPFVDRRTTKLCDRHHHMHMNSHTLLSLPPP